MPKTKPHPVLKIHAVEVFLANQKVGRMALTPQGLCAFEYDASYLQTGSSISPFHLPLESNVFLAKHTPFEGGFGVFDDSLPDGWGRLLFDRYLHKKGFQHLNLLQRFALVGSTGRGALEYRPDFGEKKKEHALDFTKLAAEAEKILTTQYSGKGLDTLYQYAGASGGARPKVFVTVNGEEWLIKFKALNDDKNIGKTEYQYSLLAKQCGIEMPETKLFDKKYFGVKRFDRLVTQAHVKKIHTISAAGLLHANYREPSLDYTSLLQACFELTKNMQEVKKLFRLMVFNVAIKNRDDHAKNFSFQFIDNEWRLSPAYDLLPSGGFNGFHTTTINGNGDPLPDDMNAVAYRVGMSKKETKQIIEEVRDVVEKK